MSGGCTGWVEKWDEEGDQAQGRGASNWGRREEQGGGRRIPPPPWEEGEVEEGRRVSWQEGGGRQEAGWRRGGIVGLESEQGQLT